MGAARGAALGGLGLTLLYAGLSNKTHAQNVTGFAKFGVAVVNRLIDPTVPLIPDLAADAATPGAGTDAQGNPTRPLAL